VAKQKKTAKQKSQTQNLSRVTVSKSQEENKSFLQKLQEDLDIKGSYLNLVLGVLIVVVAGVLLFNYFNKPNGDLGPSQNSNQETSETTDVSKENLPGKYTVKEDDTLYTIAEKYYGDGFQFSEIVKTNNLADENVIEVGQVLEIPKIELAQANPTPTPTPAASPSPILSADADSQTQPVAGGKGGAENQTEWGEKITSDTYTVQEGDWLSKIAGRAYGDIFVYQKIAEANNIANPDVIEPGMILKIPR